MPGDKIRESGGKLRRVASDGCSPGRESRVSSGPLELRTEKEFKLERTQTQTSNVKEGIVKEQFLFYQTKSPKANELITGRILGYRDGRGGGKCSYSLSSQSPLFSHNSVMVLTAFCFVEQLFAYTLHLSPLITRFNKYL